MAKQASDIIAPLKADSGTKSTSLSTQQPHLANKAKSCVTKGEVQAALAEAAASSDDCNSVNNPEEPSGLIKMRPIESMSTNGTSDQQVNSAADEEEKKSEVGLSEFATSNNEPAEPRTVNEIFKQRLVNSKRQISKQLIF